jgi:hypothetical protein
MSLGTTFSVADGGGHSPYFLTNASAARGARERADANLKRALDSDIEPAFCPACGIYQPDMVNLLRKRLGRKYEPNKWASVRTTIPWETAWREVQADDTLALYKRFVEIWPGYHGLAEKRLWELKHPVLHPVLEMLNARLNWFCYGLVVFLVFIFPVIANFFGWVRYPP